MNEKNEEKSYCRNMKWEKWEEAIQLLLENSIEKRIDMASKKTMPHQKTKEVWQVQGVDWIDRVWQGDRLAVPISSHGFRWIFPNNDSDQLHGSAAHVQFVQDSRSTRVFLVRGYLEIIIGLLLLCLKLKNVWMFMKILNISKELKIAQKN